MRAKSILTLALGAFVAVALVLTVTRPAVNRRSQAVAEKRVEVRAASLLDSSLETKAPERPAPVAPADMPSAAEVKSAPGRTDEAPVATPVRPRKEKSGNAEATALAATVPAAANHKVIAMYFHGDVRCTTCRKVEAYAREAVEEGFALQVSSGTVEFRAVNVDQAENSHFIQDYQLMNRSVVVVDQVDGTVARWVKLDNVWGLVGNRDAYLNYVQDAVRSYLEN